MIEYLLKIWEIIIYQCYCYDYLIFIKKGGAQSTGFGRFWKFASVDVVPFILVFYSELTLLIYIC